jgi:GTP-binding protein
MAETQAFSKAMFVDEVDIIVAGGAGGNGCVSFRREKFIPRGGPDGGDGGNGGSVFLLADPHYNTLQHLAGHHHWKAQRGGHGMGKKCHGKKGEDLYIHVPTGTIVHDAEHAVILKDLDTTGETLCVAKGGKGGRGNEFFKSATLQAPRKAELGEPAEGRTLHLELKLIADVGLVGKPNAGKSTLLSRLSAARPKIAAYPFTTRYPCLGIVELPGHRRFVMADLPGLIEGAHQGAGLGDEFLRHVERTRLLVHVIDVSPLDGDPAEEYRTIRAELEQYSSVLAGKEEVIVANKMDLTDSEDHLKKLRKALRGKGKNILAISGVTGKGIPELAEELWRRLHADDTLSGADVGRAT